MQCKKLGAMPPPRFPPQLHGPCVENKPSNAHDAQPGPAVQEDDTTPVRLVMVNQESRGTWVCSASAARAGHAECMAEHPCSIAWPLPYP